MVHRNNSRYSRKQTLANNDIAEKDRKKIFTHEIKDLTHEKKNEKKKNPRKHETCETHERTRSMRYSRVSRQLLIIILNESPFN